MPGLKPFQLLEINLISAQDLEPVSKKMKTYATAWVHPTRKLSTRVDTDGNKNPTWNDKFVYRVDDDFLRSDTSAVMIEIYSTGRWFRDSLVGTVRVLVGNLFPPSIRPNHHHHHNIGIRFVALQVRRPSGRPQGILNMGVSLLDSSMRSMPLYRQLSASAVGFHDLMEDDAPNLHHQNQEKNQQQNVKANLRRSRSERTTYENGSMIATPERKGAKGHENSMLSFDSSDQHLPSKTRGKKRSKSSSILSDSNVNKDSLKGYNNIIFDKPIPIVIGPGNKISDKVGLEPTSKAVEENDTGTKLLNGGPKPSNKFVFGVPTKAHSIMSDSEVGPSPSEVAAAIAQKRYPLDEERSSVLDGWSLDESVEGLRSKLERWRQTELPPLYDRGGLSSSSFQSTGQHARRHTDGGTGLFSCFGNIYGYECQCICGRPPPKGKGSRSARFSP